MESLHNRIEKVGNYSRCGEWDQHWLKVSEDVAREPYEADEQRAQNKNSKSGDRPPKRALLKLAWERIILFHGI